MSNTSFRRLAFLSSPNTKTLYGNPSSPLPLPIPHRSLPSPAGQDHDFISVFHSHLVHAEWPRLAPLASSLTPFRTTHILLRIRRDPVLSLHFFNWSLLHAPSSLSLLSRSILLHSLTRANKFKQAESLLRTALSPATPHSHDEIFDSILYSYRLCDSSPAVFDSLFKTYAHMGKFRSATETFGRMRDYGFLPTIESCNAYLSSLLDFGRADIALSFYREMGRCRISPNAYTVNMVLCAFCNSGKLDKAVDLFGKMDSMGLSPTLVSFNTLIAGYCKNGLVGSALKLKNAMRDKGLEPNVITYNTILNGFCKEGMLQDANKVFNEMKAMEVSPNTVTYNTLINGYSRTNDVGRAYRIYEDMVKNGVEVDVLTYNALIFGYCNEGKTRKAAALAKELVKGNLVPNASTFHALISGQCKRHNSERAFEIYKVMMRSVHCPNSDTFKLLISTFCKNEDFEGALEVLKDMLESWVAPDKDLLSVLADGIYRHDKRHLLTKLQLDCDGRRVIPEGLLNSLLSRIKLESDGSDCVV